MTLQETKQYTRWLVGIALIGSVVINTFWLVFPIGKDSTDSLEKRSGMQLLTDYATGCQYLAYPKGGITPRLSSSGQHIGCKPE